MPNWCNTHYKITGATEDVQKFADMLTHLQSLPEPLVKNDFGKLWLGCTVNYLGGDWQKTYCRGYITYWSRSDFQMSGGFVMKDGLIDLFVESAWSEMSEWRHFMMEHFPELAFVYLYEEPGMALYGNSDWTGKHFPERYILEIGDESKEADEEAVTEGPEYFPTIEAVAAFVSGRIAPAEPTIASIRNVLDNWQGEHKDRWFTFEAFELVDD